MSEERAAIHVPTGPVGSRLARSLTAGSQLAGSFRPLVGPAPDIVARLSGPAELLARAAEDLPEGAARPEAVAVRLRRLGVMVERGEPEALGGAGELLELCRDRGRTSVATARADPSLVSELQLGSWFQAAWRARMVRRVLTVAGRGGCTLLGGWGAPLALRTACDGAFWAGVREAATPREWDRWTRSSYVALCYHRLAGEGRPGQEDLDLSPATFATQMRILCRLGYRTLTPEAIAAFHADPEGVLPRRSVAVTADDGFLDCVATLQHHGSVNPHLFVPTSEVGGPAWWAGSEPVADWPELTALQRAGGWIGSHARHHLVLPELPPDRVHEELTGSLRDLHDRFGGNSSLLAYPHGRHDHEVRAAAVAAGYGAAFTTAVGRNGAGTDPWSLRRVGIKARDGQLGFLWKLVTGEHLPRRWERWLLSRRPRGGRP